MGVLTIAVRLLEGPVPGGQPALLPAAWVPTEPRLRVLFVLIAALLVFTLAMLFRVVLLFFLLLLLFLLFFPWDSSLETGPCLLTLQVAPKRGQKSSLAGSQLGAPWDQ